VPNNNNIWTIASDFNLYNTADGGLTWVKHQVKGLGNTSGLGVTYLWAINASEALLAADSLYTGIGPGFVYRTVDGGENWTKVFTHNGDTHIIIGMFNGKQGLLTCTSGEGQFKQQLYYTVNGGSSWKLDTINPNKYIETYGFNVNGSQAAMSDEHRVHFSANKGKTWTTNQQELQAFNIQFKDSSYAIANNQTFLLVKRPGKSWITDTDTMLTKHSICALVLDGKECWVAQGIDAGADNYYSNDSAKTFTAFRADPFKGFERMTKARNGKTIVANTGSGGNTNPTLWINTRQQKSFTDELENIKTTSSVTELLRQNIPNPFSNSTTINYTLPQHYSSAKIIITDKNGNTLKQINLYDKDKGSVLVDASTLSSGAYQYSLIVDGRMISSKQMMLIK